MIIGSSSDECYGLGVPDTEIVPFQVQVADDVITDLRDRLARTRWPDQLADTAWEYGTDLTCTQRLCEYWRTGYDWRRFEEACNRFAQYRTVIDDQLIHFVHVRSPVVTARPLLLIHGWPGSILEFSEVIGPLTDPAAHGGQAEEAFHVIAPSLPGYGFSGPTSDRGWNNVRIAQAFGELIERLGYRRFFAQGGDWGALITLTLADLFSERVAAAHINLLAVPPPAGTDSTEELTEDELAGLGATRNFQTFETGYQAIQSTKPQTLAYGLTDSPAGLAAWILEKFHSWSDNKGQLDDVLTMDQILDDISIYWITGTINSSMRLYAETIGPARSSLPGAPAVPLGHSAFPAEIMRVPRSWAEHAYPTLCYWQPVPRGGHFAAMEQPQIFVDEIRTFFGRRAL